MPFNLNPILISLVVLSGLVTTVSGILMIVKSIFMFRAQINRSINSDLEVVRVTRLIRKEEEASKEKDLWKDEIGFMEQLLTTLTNLKESGSFWKIFLYGRPSLSFEIANPSDSEEIFFYVSVPKKFRRTVEKQIQSYFANASLEICQDYSIFAPGNFVAASTLGLRKGFARPIKTYENLEADPLNEITNALNKLAGSSEGATIQVILQPIDGYGWRDEGRRIAREMQQGKRLKEVNRSMMSKIGGEVGKAIGEVFMPKSDKSQDSGEKNVNLTPEEQELVKTIEKKATKAALKVNIRLIASGDTQARAEEVLSYLENAFVQFENPEVNSFMIKKRTKSKKFIFDYVFRNFQEEDAIVLGVEEIAGIFHFPISTTDTPRIRLLKSKAAPPPTNIPREGLLLGYNDYRGNKTEIRLSPDDRRRHLYIIGQTGTGKSNFLKYIAQQDVRNGKGLCIIDPHGDFAEDVLASVPKERAEDVVFFDPSDTERPFGLNMMEFDPAHPEQKTFVINEMINIFDKLYDLKATGGPMFEQYMRNAMMLIMDDPDSGSTLMEISKVLADADFRKMKLSRCKSQIVIDFWTKEAEKAGGEASLANMVPYITSKLTPFISNDMMRPIISQQKSTLDFRKIMDEEKILIISLSKGKIGEMNAKLLGMIIIGKILMGALSRVDMEENDRKDFYLYIDEFQNVTTDSIAQILSEARKYRLDLLIAHQFIGQLSEEISKAVFGNVGSMMTFRVGSEDAEFLEKQFAPTYGLNDMVNLDNYNCIARLLVNNESTKPFNMKTYERLKGDQELANYLKELSRLKYGRDADIVNQEILERSRVS